MNLKEKLDYHYHIYNKKEFPADPLIFLSGYKSKMDIEAAGLVSSVFAYGNVTAINSTLRKIFEITGNPWTFISGASSKEIKQLKGIKHRFYSGEDVYALFTMMHKFYLEYGSVKEFFYGNYKEEDKDLHFPMILFSEYMYSGLLKTRKQETPGIKFMFPSPESGSACKRMNLFLRWMIRKDEIDYGIWNKIPPSKLLIPVDTHIARICKELKLTTLKNVSWRMAEQITDNLRKYSPEDPVKYDFAICHIGMSRQNI